MSILQDSTIGNPRSKPDKDIRRAAKGRAVVNRESQGFSGTLRVQRHERRDLSGRRPSTLTTPDLNNRDRPKTTYPLLFLSTNLKKSTRPPILQKNNTKKENCIRCEEIDYEIFGNDMQVVEVELAPGETVIGEGLFLATLQCTGTVYLQSLPFSRLADRILEHAPATGGSS